MVLSMGAQSPTMLTSSVLLCDTSRPPLRDDLARINAEDRTLFFDQILGHELSGIGQSVFVGSLVAVTGVDAWTDESDLGLTA